MADWISTDQWRRIGNTEEEAGDGLDVRTVCDIGRGLNNLHDYVLTDRLCFGSIGGPLITNAVGTTEILCMFLGGPWFIADGYSAARLWMNTERVAGAGTTTWKVVLGRPPIYSYGVDAAYNAAQVSGETYATVVTNSDDRVIATVQLDIAALNNQRVWGYLTYTNDDGSTQSRVWSLDLMLEKTLAPVV